MKTDNIYGETGKPPTSSKSWKLNMDHKHRKTLASLLRLNTSHVVRITGARRGPELIVSASDDNTIKLWDARKRNPIASFDSSYPVTSVLFNDTAEKVSFTNFIVH